MDPRFDVYVTYIPEDSDDDSGDDAHTTSGIAGGRDIEPSPSREPGLKKRAGVPNKHGKARRRSGGGGDAESNS